MATAFAYTTWFWDAYGWAGVAVIGFASWFLLLMSFVLFAIAVRWLRPPAVLDTLSPVAALPEWLEEVPTDFQKLKQQLDNFTRIWVATDPVNNESLELVRSDIAKLRSRLENIEASLRPKSEGILGGGLSQKVETRLDSIEAKFEDTRHYLSGLVDSLSHSLKHQITIQHEQYEIIIRSLRARDAEAILHEADAIVMNLGGKLIAADAYENGATWSRDHNLWGHRLDKIDWLMAQWQGDKHQPFLDVKHYDYEREDRKAPAHILDEDKNATRYKHVCISHERYLHARDNVFAYFAAKAHELPG